MDTDQLYYSVSRLSPANKYTRPTPLRICRAQVLNRSAHQMEGVRRNIALKLKPSVKDGKSPSDASRKKEGEALLVEDVYVYVTRATSATNIISPPAATASIREPAAVTEDPAPSPPPPPPPAQDHPAPTSPPRAHPLTQHAPPTTAPVTTGTSHTRHTIISGKTPPESSMESG